MCSINSYKLKDVYEWSSGERGDVLEFLESVLPGHNCHNHFKYTNGHVLVSLSKEDLRRQCKSEEAANVIWVELAKFRKILAEKQELQRTYPSSYVIYVRTPVDVAVEIQVGPTETTLMLKHRLLDLEGTPVESQRLICNGHHMEDSRTLASYKIGQGSVLLLVPRLSNQVRCIPPSTPRGQLMIPGNQPWQPSVRPYIPVLPADIYRPFPMSLEFEQVTHHHRLLRAMTKVNDEPVTLLIDAADGSLPVETKVRVDGTSEILRVDTVGDIIVPNARYSAMLRIPNDRELKVTLVTGNRVQ